MGLQPWWGRMSSQVPMNMTITGAMIALSHTPALNTFWQLANQTYNAAVNYTNRSGGDSAGVQNLAIAWGIASTGAIIASTQAQKFINRSAFFQARNPAITRAVAPFLGIAIANMINIPIMRNKEFINGISLVDKNGDTITETTSMVPAAISKVVASRLMIAACCVLVPAQLARVLSTAPGLRNAIASKKYGKLSDVALTIFSVGVCQAISVPTFLAVWPQYVPVDVKDLSSELQKEIHDKRPGCEIVYYNKGL